MSYCLRFVSYTEIIVKTLGITRRIGRIESRLLATLTKEPFKEVKQRDAFHLYTYIYMRKTEEEITEKEFMVPAV